MWLCVRIRTRCGAMRSHSAWLTEFHIVALKYWSIAFESSYKRKAITVQLRSYLVLLFPTFSYFTVTLYLCNCHYVKLNVKVKLFLVLLPKQYTAYFTVYLPWYWNSLLHGHISLGRMQRTVSWCHSHRIIFRSARYPLLMDGQSNVDSKLAMWTTQTQGARTRLRLHRHLIVFCTMCRLASRMLAGAIMKHSSSK